jgi:hypothetical protein
MIVENKENDYIWGKFITLKKFQSSQINVLV